MVAPRKTLISLMNIGWPYKVHFTISENHCDCFETFDKVGNYMGEGAQQLQEGGVADRSIMA